MNHADYIYLASPYSSTNPNQRKERFDKVCSVAAQLMLEGHNVFCPIAHSHPIGEVMDTMLDAGYSTNGDFWKKQDVPILRHASALFVVTLDGWEESKGVKWEMELAKALHIPIRFISPYYGKDYDYVKGVLAYS